MTFGMAVEAVGWLSSLVLVATIVKQVHRQWSAGTSEGVSKWLFLGQIAASSGFTIYSALVGNVVFIATNAALLGAAIVGLVILFRQRGLSAAAVSSSPSPSGRPPCETSLRRPSRR